MNAEKAPPNSTSKQMALPFQKRRASMGRKTSLSPWRRRRPSIAVLRKRVARKAGTLPTTNPTAGLLELRRVLRLRHSACRSEPGRHLHRGPKRGACSGALFRRERDGPHSSLCARQLAGLFGGSYFGSLIGILHPYSLLRVLAGNAENLGAEVVWQYGPLVEADWARESEFVSGAR